MEIENVILSISIIVVQVIAGFYAYRIIRLSREKSLDLLYLWPLLFIPGGPGERKPELLYRLLVVSVVTFIVIGITELLFEVEALPLSFHIFSMLILSILLLAIIYTIYKLLTEAIKIKPYPAAAPLRNQPTRRAHTGVGDEKVSSGERKKEKMVESEAEVQGEDS